MKIDRKTTLKDVAQQANVSLSTASHALNGTAPLTTLVRERVLEAARSLGYLENRRQKATIATLRVVLLAMTNDAAPQSDLNMVSWTMLNGFRRECERRGIRIVPFVSATSRLDPVAVAQAADADNVDGIVVLNDDRSQLVQALSALGKPVVLINGEDPAMIVDTVTAENRFGARLGIEHLLSLGHRNILHITWKGRTTIRRRFDGYSDAFLAAGFPVPADMVIEVESYEPQWGETAIRRLLAEERPLRNATAIFCAADNLALGCLKALTEAGVRVPDDVSVLGFDDIMPAAFSAPPLSTVQLPADRLGGAALSLLEQRLVAADPTRPAHRLELGCRLVLRGSIAPPPK
ncbi:MULTISPECIES: LacI family DNA-binding transcriptional regulator [Agrobacterium]|uniref:LacI family DNA-binding transcriptional regulator n=1 Tax=Agrobacterium TaxID=357 RepID=UPI00039E536F|nr:MULTISPECIES: LacI family DNA-binding transcriptional regulator [Agrobacterium]AYM13869.1 LacI family transcriptional regulator [Agrobacterium tumefaciens]MBO9111441.1 LacI family DNA-binding transcriptional regulator [Agrobacterium sp. S2/73]MDP9757507.1 LacI family purine nucleotide synthesis repressor [Agrobacterium tumefaciens]MDQ1218743.1 LacI family purine nucleotide synthesis repressor [Agrobacterium sp. SORGH_AS_0745]QXZ75372.1 LacI family DNA-binding transcriptional regulator [Agro